MFKAIFIFVVSVVGLPIYAACVAILLGLGAVFGWTYTDASVYVCEYVQPWLTAALAVILLIYGIKGALIYYRKNYTWAAVTLTGLYLLYAGIAVYCIRDFFLRIAAYRGMSNREIFDYVVAKLSAMASVYPSGRFRIFTGESISYGYIMANMEVYILPVSVVLLCGLIQWRIRKRINSR